MLPIFRAITRRFPALKAHLSRRARYLAAIGTPHHWDAKTADFMERTIRRYILAVYRGQLGFEFLDLMASLIEQQFTRAYNQALREEGVEMDAQFQSHLDNLVINQFPFVDGLFDDILQAVVDESPVEPLLSRADLWANRYNEVVNEAHLEIARRFGGKLVWRMGATEKHCTTCAALNGLVAFGVDWDASGLHPQNAPNGLLECGGWRCDCSLEPTEERRTRNSLDKLMSIAAGAG
jgi:hypothetical protein